MAIIFSSLAAFQVDLFSGIIACRHSPNFCSLIVNFKQFGFKTTESFLFSSSFCKPNFEKLKFNNSHKNSKIFLDIIPEKFHNYLSMWCKQSTFKLNNKITKIVDIKDNN